MRGTPYISLAPLVPVCHHEEVGPFLSTQTPT